MIAGGGSAVCRPGRRHVRPLTARLAVAVLALAAATGARAALFEDDEARKAILELRSRVTANEESSRARMAEMAAAQAQLLEQIGALRRSLLDLNNQLEQLRREQAQLRGQDEQVLRELSELQRRQKDAGQALDDRLRKLEPSKVSLDGQEFLAGTDETRVYEEAVGFLRGGDFARASTALASFLDRWPVSGYAPSARFWLGNALYGRREHKEAIAVFRQFLAASPAHPRAPEAMLAVANSQIEMKDTKAARATLQELLKAHPSSEAAQAGRQRLVGLK